MFVKAVVAELCVRTEGEAKEKWSQLPDLKRSSRPAEPNVANPPSRLHVQTPGLCAICLILLVPSLGIGFDLEILSEIGVNFRLREANDFRREFDEGQAPLFHHVVYRPLADIQSPGNL